MEHPLVVDLEVVRYTTGQGGNEQTHREIYALRRDGVVFRYDESARTWDAITGGIPREAPENL